MVHGISCALLVVCAVVSSVRIAPGAENIVIDLKREASIRSATILLKDVADVHGQDRDAIERLSNIVLGKSPDLGSVRTLSRYQINECIQTAMRPFGDIQFSGTETVQVRTKGKPVDRDQIAVLLKSHIVRTTSWKESDIEICIIGNLDSVEMPPDGAELRFSQTPAIAGRRTINALFEIVQSGRTMRSFWVNADIILRTDAWVAAKDILPGKIVESSDFVKQWTPIQDLRAIYIRTLDEVMGKTARHRIPAGDLIVREAFAEPFLIKRGETVQLRLQREGIMLNSQARAEEDGKLGQMIRVRNQDFSTVIKAQVIGRSQVILP